MTDIQQLPRWSDDQAAYARAWHKRRRRLDPEFAKAQSKAARGWQLANPVRNARNQYRQTAKRRGLSWELSEQDFESLVLADCSYCGLPADPPRINGVDRIDNSGGYIAGNVVSACAQCNYAKRHHSLDEFLAWAKRLVAFQEG